LKKPIRIAAGIALGAAAGFAYYYFIGCQSGACPLTSNPYISTGYGMIIGLLFTMPGSKQDKKS